MSGMNDVFLEQIVKRKETAKTMILKVLVFAAGIMVFLISMMFIGVQFIGTFALLIGIGAIYIAWLVATGMNLEFEYIYTNGEIDFDKIMAKRKRKRIITVKITSFEVFEKYDAQKEEKSKYEVKYDLSASLTDEGTYYTTFRNKEGKNCILYFTPNERLLEAINVQFRRKRYGQ